MNMKPQSLQAHGKNKPFARQAKVVVRAGGQTRELVVDLNTGLITSDHVYAGHGYPPLTFKELYQAIQLTKWYPSFKDSLVRRGLNSSEISCLPLTVGWFGELVTRRAVRISCFNRDGITNIYARPINGITILFDLESMRVARYLDRYLD
ncbi:hypothetical protein Ancab_030397 [Ancistrocladus abbreviatus]